MCVLRRTELTYNLSIQCHLIDLIDRIDLMDDLCMSLCVWHRYIHVVHTGLVHTLCRYISYIQPLANGTQYDMQVHRGVVSLRSIPRLLLRAESECFHLFFRPSDKAQRLLCGARGGDERAQRRTQRRTQRRAQRRAQRSIGKHCAHAGSHSWRATRGVLN